MRRSAPTALLLAVAAFTFAAAAVATPRPAAAAIQTAPTQGSMLVARDGADPPAELPLVRTAVHVQVSGVAAQVEVVQSFHNPYAEAIEAVYVFPLPDDAAVGAMTIHIGDRTIRGVIQTREQARATYQEARRSGKTTALLEQERPNVFTQSVANIPAGQEVEVELVYDVLLRQDAGSYELAYPMVVGPRYIPGTPQPPPAAGGGWSPDTDRVPDASRITPPVRPPGTRSGQDIEIAIELDAGLPILDLASPTHELAVERLAPERAIVRLAGGATIPNKDLVLRWRLAGDATRATILSHHAADSGYLSLVLQPPAPAAVGRSGVELVFVVDTSGSMDGEPLSLVKRAMRFALRHLHADDSFQILDFSSSVGGMAAPLPATADNLRDGLSLINGLVSAGGTEMLSGIRAALASEPADGRIRIVCFMTDGFIGNEAEILAAVEADLGQRTRLFSFGVGSSPNRYLLERLATVGHGAAQYFLLDEDPQPQIERFYARLEAPILSDITIDWGGLAVTDVEPASGAELFAGQPLVVVARYTDAGAGSATVQIQGSRGGKSVRMEVPAALSGEPDERDALARLWARRRIERLLASQYAGERPEVVRDVTALALAHGLMSPYTSLVAVDEQVVQRDGKPVTLQVPVEMPEGVAYGGVFGNEVTSDGRQNLPAGGIAIGADEEFYGETISLDYDAPRWQLQLSTSFGLGDSGADRSAAIAGLHLGLTRTLGEHLGLGLNAGLLLPSLDASLGLSRFLVDLSWRLADTSIQLHLGAGPALSFDGRLGLGATAAIAVPLPLRWRHPLSADLRADVADLRDGEPEMISSVTSVSLGLSITY